MVIPLRSGRQNPPLGLGGLQVLEKEEQWIGPALATPDFVLDAHAFLRWPVPQARLAGSRRIHSQTWSASSGVAARPSRRHHRSPASASSRRGRIPDFVARYRGKFKRRYFRADAAFANPEVYEFLEAEGFKYAIRLPANQILQERIGYLLKRPVGRPPIEVRRYHASFSYQAQSWKIPRRVVVKVEWHPGELYPRVGFIVTNMTRPPERVVAFYNQRGTAEQWIKEGKNAVKWTRLSCCSFAANAVRLQLHALAYNLANFMRTLALPEVVKRWSLTSLREKLVKIGAKVVCHGRYVIFQMAEVAVPKELFQEIVRLIDGLRPDRPQRSNWRGGCVITTEGVRLDARKNGQIAGSDVVRDRWNAGSTAQPTYGLPGNPAVCYRPTRSRVHLGNVG